MRSQPIAALLAVAALAACATITGAAPLNVGDKAPPLTVGKWVRGAPVERIEDDKVYVVEFWATWCGPCKVTMPKLSDMQRKHGDGLVIIGQNIWERDAADAKVAPFLDAMGDKVAYRIATDDKSSVEGGAMAAGWMDAAERQYLPTAFIVGKGGTILWIGDAQRLEPVLDRVMAGSFDLAEARRVAAEEQATEARAADAQEAFNETVAPLLAEKDYAGSATAIDALVGRFPDAKEKLTGVKLGVLLSAKRYDDAYVLADQIAADAAADGNAERLNALAWTIVDKKDIERRDYDRAERYATRAAELTEMKEPGVLDTLARVHAEKGNYARAIELETKAIELADGEMKAELVKTLDAYKAKAAN